MLTCGQTKLVEAAESFINSLGAENIDCLFYQRKNEYRSQLQPSDFVDDAQRLAKKIDGRVVRFGKLHSHHTLLFHSTKEFRPVEQDKTCELLMYDMAPEVIRFLTNENLSKKELRDFFKLEQVFEGFTFDDFVFKPYGYSLNGIKEGQYLTIHVTPQETCPYVSFETNLLICEKSQVILNHFVEVLRPGSFDVLNFNCSTDLSFEKSYVKTIHVRDRLTIAYDVDFRYFNKQQEHPETMYTYNSLEEL
jgi:S-adenosylmethionine decarboxylase